jgi:hypothetical protein
MNTIILILILIAICIQNSKLSDIRMSVEEMQENFCPDEVDAYED